MLKNIKKYITALLATAMIASPMLIPSLVVSAAASDTTPDISGSLCEGTKDAAGGTDCTTGATNSSLKNIAANIVNVLSILVGIVAVIMIIFGGFRYITSGGDSGKVGGAKNSLIYAIVGLLIVALAQFIVHYVLNTATNTGLTQ